jgi:hypothetical protein
VLGAIGNQSGAEQTLITFDADATDADVPAQTLTFSLDPGAPAGAGIDSVTGVFDWTPSAAGLYTVTVRVTDNGSPNMSDSETVTITVQEYRIYLPFVARAMRAPYTVYLPLVMKRYGP